MGECITPSAENMASLQCVVRSTIAAQPPTMPIAAADACCVLDRSPAVSYTAHQTRKTSNLFDRSKQRDCSGALCFPRRRHYRSSSYPGLHIERIVKASVAVTLRSHRGVVVRIVVLCIAVRWNGPAFAFDLSSNLNDGRSLRILISLNGRTIREVEGLAEVQCW